jgi:D-lactate dehydrogenase (cytochrome)
MKVFDICDDYVDFLHDESRREGTAQKIAFPTCMEDVREALHIAAENGWPITVQGGRTGITGGCVPGGGLILNLSRMKQIGEVSHTRMSVEPGAVLADIRDAVAGIRDPVLFFPSDLTETSATIGGMIANNASGACSFRFGSVRPWICGLTVVLPNGEVVELERGVHKADGRSFKLGSIKGELPELPMPDVKTAAGYFVKSDMDLVDLFIGAEGTLGIITKATLQLLPKQEVIYGLTAFFVDEAQALNFVHFLRDFSKPLAIEFFDSHALELLRRMKAENPAFSGLPELNPEYHTALYFEFEGEVPSVVVEEVERALDCWMAEGEHEIEALKKFRHAIPESVNMFVGERKKTIPELTKLGTDMSVPDGRLEDVMRMYHKGLDEAGLEYVIFGHIGNNHVHVNILPRSLEEYEKGRALYLEWARQIVSMGGSVSAEHGIGKIKTEFLQLMFGDEGIQRMRQLRELFDPAGLLNRGNLFNSDH